MVLSSDSQPAGRDVEVQSRTAAVDGGLEGIKGSENEEVMHYGPKKRVVVIGLGMVGISFM